MVQFGYRHREMPFSTKSFAVLRINSGFVAISRRERAKLSLLVIYAAEA
jgi:hypothetical protein